jgi:hypothetical protein
MKQFSVVAGGLLKRLHFLIKIMKLLVFCGFLIFKVFSAAQFKLANR